MYGCALARSQYDCLGVLLRNRSGVGQGGLEGLGVLVLVRFHKTLRILFVSLQNVDFPL